MYIYIAFVFELKIKPFLCYLMGYIIYPVVVDVRGVSPGGVVLGRQV